MKQPDRAPGSTGPAGGAAASAAKLDGLREAAFRHHRQGELEPAAALYREVLAAAPEDPGALNGLGCLMHQRGDPAAAAELLRRATAAAPEAADLQANYGHSLSALGRLEEASRAYEASLAAAPGQAELWHALASLRDHLFDGPGAIEAAEKLVALAPRTAASHLQLGQLYRKQARLTEAVASLTEARRLAPQDGELARQLGQSLAEDEQLEAAEEVLRLALEDAPDEPALVRQLAQLLILQDRFEEAASLADRLLAVTLREMATDGEDSGIVTAIAILQLAKREESALAATEQALAQRPNSDDLLVMKASLLREVDRLGDSIRILERVTARAPEHNGAQISLGLALQDKGEIGAACAAYRAATEAAPTQAADRSALVMSLNYEPHATQEDLWRASRDWNERFGLPLARAHRSHENDRSPDRRLRVGYVSPDFRRHSVAYFAEPLLEDHDRTAVEVFCYAELANLDDTSRRLKGLADHWRNTVGQGDRQVAAMIRRDRIDILVDLAGHSASNRLCTFALKPAPLQVTWLGYPGTTGLDAMDYRLTDAVCDPPGEADRWHSESLIRLPNGFLCYRPETSAPAVTPPPCHAGGRITFGSFNNPAKISAPVVETWSALLHRVPDSRLLLKGRGLGDETAGQALLERFAARGIGPERLVLRSQIKATEAHLASYGEIDLALDSFPYNGTTTSCEALWMGVPLVTLEGDRHAGRVGMSLLRQLGLEAFVAVDRDAYVTLAASLADAPERLSEYRKSLRARMRASSLLDGRAFASAVEQAYREIWIRWCEPRRRI